MAKKEADARPVFWETLFCGALCLVTKNGTP